MNLEWVLNPATQYAATATGMAACLYLFLSQKRDLLATEARAAKKLSASEAEWTARMQSLEERYQELSRVSGLLVPPAPIRSGLNISKRSQALQMLRRGETAQDISAALAIPRNEIDLLVKVQRMTPSGFDA
ncbi:MAG TPA: hypothetical protein VL285_16825 [Bryobacteraceae bacterium]|nr:hypothetical protein [Bryobacteraceae bacterium]